MGHQRLKRFYCHHTKIEKMRFQVFLLNSWWISFNKFSSNNCFSGFSNKKNNLRFKQVQFALQTNHFSYFNQDESWADEEREWKAAAVTLNFQFHYNFHQEIESITRNCVRKGVFLPRNFFSKTISAVSRGWRKEKIWKELIFAQRVHDSINTCSIAIEGSISISLTFNSRAKIHTKSFAAVPW